MKILKNKSIVVFEINDDNRKHEFKGDGYRQLFIDFIQSLGFDAKLKYDFGSDVIINDEEFNIDIDNASYMSKNGWTREQYVRKPINRFVILKRISHTASTIIKIHFNKEYDGDKLREKINAAIQAKIDQRQRIIDVENKDKENTTAIAENFIRKNGFKDIVSYVRIHKGQISFTIKNASAQITFKLDGDFLFFDNYSVFSKEVKQESLLSEMFDELVTLRKKTEQLMDMVYSDKAFPIDRRRMSCNTNRGITNGCGWDDKYSTKNNKGEQLILGHDDIDCFEELEKEGFIKNNGTLLNMYPELTDKGWKCISQIREFKGKGGNYKDFVFKK